ncbi:MAG: J domain-containing protein, partial [Cyanobacteriota bacterium]
PSPPPSSPLPSASHYELLQLPVTASPQQLRQAFRHLSKVYHPDTTSLPPSQAEEAFRRLQQAYAVLSDPEARRAYDTRLQARSAPAAAAAPVSFAAAPRPDSVRRSLSGGEWFALLLLGLAMVLSLVLGIGLAWMRGAELVRWPSWWQQLQAEQQELQAEQAAADPAAVVSAAPVSGGVTSASVSGGRT